MVGVRKSTLVKFQTQVVIAFKRRLNEYIPNKLDFVNKPLVLLGMKRLVS